MAYEFKLLKFQIEPLASKIILQYDGNRQYLLISNSITSLNEFYIMFYPYEQANIPSVPDGAFAIYQGGYYEPNKIPSNVVSVCNINAVNTLNGFILF